MLTYSWKVDGLDTGEETCEVKLTGFSRALVLLQTALKHRELTSTVASDLPDHRTALRWKKNIRNTVLPTLSGYISISCSHTNAYDSLWLNLDILWWSALCHPQLQVYTLLLPWCWMGDNTCTIFLQLLLAVFGRDGHCCLPVIIQLNMYFISLHIIMYSQHCRFTS